MNLDIKDIGSGPFLATIISGIHGDERSPLRITRLLERCASLNGRIRIIRHANPFAVAAKSRCTPEDGKDLNRCFPGSAEGSITEQLALRVLSSIRGKVVIDLHAFQMKSPLVAIIGDDTRMRELNQTLAQRSGICHVWHVSNSTHPGSLAGALNAQRIPNIAIEMSDARNLTRAQTRACLDAIGCILGAKTSRSSHQKHFRRTIITSTLPGTFHPKIETGTLVHQGQIIGRINDSPVSAPFAGEILHIQERQVLPAGADLAGIAVAMEETL